MQLTKEQLLRYQRHIILPEIGKEGQIKLKNSKVFIVGAGGLGIPASLYLTALGIGKLAIIDNDIVELSNLQRQIVYNINSLGKQKAVILKENLILLNPDIEIIAINERLSEKNIYDLLKNYDVIVDCSDNYSTKFLINDACVNLKKPVVTGGVEKFEGLVTVIIPGDGHCLRCIFEDVKTEPAENQGIIGAVPGVIGALQALEVTKIILGIGNILKNEILIFDGLNTSFRKIHVPRNKECPTCGKSFQGHL